MSQPPNYRLRPLVALRAVRNLTARSGRYGELWSAAGDRGWTDWTPSSSCRTAVV